MLPFKFTFKPPPPPNKIIPHANIWTKQLLVVMLYDWKLFKNIGYDTDQNFTTFDKYLSVSSPITCQVKMTCINANKNQSYHISLVSILFIFQITSLDFFYTSVWVLVRVRFTLGVYLSAQVTGMPCSSERCGKRESIQVRTVFFFLQSAHHYDVCFRLCPSLQFFGGLYARQSLHGRCLRFAPGTGVISAFR